MEAATSKREAYLQSNVIHKAKRENAKAAAVVAAAAAKTSGTDAASLEAKTALYHRLQAADVARQLARAKAMPKGRGDVIIVAIDNPGIRLPPPELSRRLSVVGGSLLATAKARQAGAAARRLSARHAALLKASKANERRAAALARVGKASAALKTKVTAGHERSLVSLALAEGKRLHLVAANTQRHVAATRRVTEAGEALKRAGVATKTEFDGALERRAATLRKIAKTGVAAVRLAAFKSRREAQRAAVLAKMAKAQERCASATEKRDAYLAKRVQLARKRMVAMHPKREVAPATEEATEK